MATVNHFMMRALITGAFLCAALGLSGCGAMRGEVIGVSVNVAGFTVGVSGKLPAP